MQYFITHAYNAHADEISIHDPRIVYQCHTVLRMKIGTQICIQDTPHRYTVAITSINKKCIE
jgi:16S rRNA U1498 N3-methylase RsmE